jgi:beta-galactosidase
LPFSVAAFSQNAVLTEKAMKFTITGSVKISVFFLLASAGFAGVAFAKREVMSLDRSWRFHQGDIAFPIPKDHHQTYSLAKAGNANGPVAGGFDDTGWRVIDLPHDWVVEGPFDETENCPQGYRPRGIGFYRRHFKLDTADEGKHFELQFDGIATHATVWFNGTLVARNFCGYTSFHADITPIARFGDQLNTITVRVDANAMEGWWYEGGGIYRHTWLVKRDPLHIVTDGIFANPVKSDSGSWTVPVEVTAENAGSDAAAAEVEVHLFDPTGAEVGSARTPVTMDPLHRGVVRLKLDVTSPQLWSVDKPTLYQVRTRLLCDGKITDEVTTRIGFRTIRFDADLGFFLNDQPLKIKGTCNHQDHAGVGVAVPDSLWEFRLRRLKEMGSNAYRCAHHPPAKEFLDACDRMGMLVMNENRNFNTSDECMRELEWMVRRDRNRPSVILWSVFNEEPMQGTRQGYEMVRRMTAAVKALDSTRPVTAAMNGGHFAPVNVSQAVDVAGFNYSVDGYDVFHERNPDKPMLSSEDTAALMIRGEYETDREKHIVASYDDEAASFGKTQREAWKLIAGRPFVAGGFVWTGFDYHGEPTPFTWPTAASLFGCMDLCGFPKTAFHIRRALWVKDEPVLHLAPHWNWPGREGKPVKVLSITNAETVELKLNGESLGVKPVDPFEFATWQVIYQPGKLEAIAMKDGREIARTAVETTGPPVALRLTPDRKTLAGDGRDAMPVTVEAFDSDGRPVPTANLPIDFELTGPAAIIGLGNGDPNSHEPEKGNRRSLFNGLAQVIVRSLPDGNQPLVLQAKAAGLAPAVVSIGVNTAAGAPGVPPASPIYTLLKWRMSPSGSTPPDPNQLIASNDQNTWQEVWTDKLREFPNGNFAVFRTVFEPFHAVRNEGGTITFTGISGKAQIWLDGKQVGNKDRFERAPLTIHVPPGEGMRTLSLLIETRDGEPAGMDRAVTVEPLAPVK